MVTEAGQVRDCSVEHDLGRSGVEAEKFKPVVWNAGQVLNLLVVRKCNT